MEEVVEEERVRQTNYVDTSLQAPSVIVTYEDAPACSSYGYGYQPVGWSNNVVIGAGFRVGHGGRSYSPYRPPVRNQCVPQRSLGYRNGGYARPAWAHNNSTVQYKAPNTFNGHGHYGGGGRRGHR